jgi:hypothetical protein
MPATTGDELLKNGKGCCTIEGKDGLWPIASFAGVVGCVVSC